MSRVKLDPAAAYGRHPPQPHQLIDRVTPTEQTIVLCHLGVPRIDPDDWSLSIDGLAQANAPYPRRSYAAAAHRDHEHSPMLR